MLSIVVFSFSSLFLINLCEVRKAGGFINGGGKKIIFTLCNINKIYKREKKALKVKTGEI